MKNYLLLSALVTIASMQAMDDLREQLRTEVAFFRAVAAGQLAVVNQNKIAFPGYEDGHHIKTPEEIMQLYILGSADYKHSCDNYWNSVEDYEIVRKTDNEASVMNWNFKMFVDFINDRDLDLDLSIFETEELHMPLLLREDFNNRLLKAEQMEHEFCSIIDDIKKNREKYRQSLLSGNIEELNNGLSLTINLFEKPLRAIAFDEKYENKDLNATLLPAWTPPTPSTVSKLVQLSAEDID